MIELVLATIGALAIPLIVRAPIDGGTVSSRSGRDLPG
jgi:hypothetical protein